jgi:hypothetical protein
LSPSTSPVLAATPATVCELLCMSAPSTIISSVPFFSRLKWTAGGHGLLRARPRSFQVTPDIPDRRRATQQKEVRPTGPTASKRVSSPPARDLLLSAGHHRRGNHNSKPQRKPPRPVSARLRCVHSGPGGSFCAWQEDGTRILPSSSWGKTRGRLGRVGRA